MFAVGAARHFRNTQMAPGVVIRSVRLGEERDCSQRQVTP